jgi:hypothetical protein
MSSQHFGRGAVLKCLFPYIDRPTEAGPDPHYCLYVDDLVHNGCQYVAGCYGTSRLDEGTLDAHSGAVLSVDNDYIRARMPGRVTHFVCDHVAVIPIEWVYGDFHARLDFIRERSRMKDQRRQRLYAQFEAIEEAMERAAHEAVRYLLEAGVPGLPPGKQLRK